MSATEIQPAGRELDAQVAERLTGKQIHWADEHPYLQVDTATYYDINNKPVNLVNAIPYYSTEISAAWELVEKAKLSLIREVDDGDDVEWMCGPLNITGIGNREGTDLSDVGVKFTSNWRLATTAPHAIVLAFLALPDGLEGVE